QAAAAAAAGFNPQSPHSTSFPSMFAHYQNYNNPYLPLHPSLRSPDPGQVRKYEESGATEVSKQSSIVVEAELDEPPAVVDPNNSGSSKRANKSVTNSSDPPSPGTASPLNLCLTASEDLPPSQITER